MVAIPNTERARIDPAYPELCQAETVAIVVATIDFGYRYVAVSVLWSCNGVIAAPTPEMAVLNAIDTIRLAHPEYARLRFVSNLPRDNQIWTHAHHIACTTTDWWIELPSPADRFMVRAAVIRTQQIWSPTLPPPPVDQGPLAVATDGSVRHKRAGFAWLSSAGHYGLDGCRSSRKRVGSEAVLVAELLAINAAINALPRHRLTIFADSQNAIIMLERWKEGELVMPRGYPDEPLEAQWCLYTMRRRVLVDRDRVDVQWVRGHSGMPLNSGANALARLSSGRYRAALSEDEYYRRAAHFAETFATEYRRTAGVTENVQCRSDRPA